MNCRKGKTTSVDYLHLLREWRSCPSRIRVGTWTRRSRAPDSRPNSWGNRSPWLHLWSAAWLCPVNGKNICYSLLFVANSVKRFRHLDECMRSALVPFQGFPWISELPFPGRNNRKVCGPSTRRSKRKLILDIALRGRYKRCRPFSSFCDRKPKRISPEYIDLLAPTTFSSAPFRLPAIFTILFNMKSKRKGNKRRIWSLQCN